VTLARPAGFIPAGPATIAATLPRASGFAAVGVLAALNAQADQIIANLSWQSPLDTFLNLGGVSAIMWAAMAAAWKIGSEGRRSMRGRLDFAVLATVILLSFVPISYSAQAGLLVCASYMLATANPTEDPERRAAFVLLALTGPLIWGRLLLRLFEAPILAFDARIVGAAIGSDVHGNVVRFPDETGQFIIGDPCSSVHNMSLAIVLWTTAAMLFRIRVDRRYVMVGMAMVGLMFGLNILRLSIMGLFPANFEFLHVGGGAILFAWTGLIGAALLAGHGIIDATARQR
jgi:exosortase/archaeosortase family protein